MSSARVRSRVARRDNGLDRIGELLGGEAPEIAFEDGAVGGRIDFVDAPVVRRAEFEEAIERVVAGLEKKNRLINSKERKIVAYHELGHAVVALSLPGTDPVQKISIIPRGIAALGYTMQVPTEDRFLMKKSELLNRIATLLGGRAAEEIVFNEVSTGAHNDLSRATDIARSIIKKYGMSEKVGQVYFSRKKKAQFLDMQPEGAAEYSNATAVIRVVFISKAPRLNKSATMGSRKIIRPTMDGTVIKKTRRMACPKVSLRAL